MITRNLNLFAQHVNEFTKLFQLKAKLQGKHLMKFCLLIALALTVSVMTKAQSSNSTGSVLIFPYYDSGAVPAQKNTQFTIVNTSNAPVKVLLIISNSRFGKPALFQLIEPSEFAGTLGGVFFFF